MGLYNCRAPEQAVIKGRVCAAVVAAAIAISCACVIFAPTPAPIRVLRAAPVPGARTLIVLLPGRGGAPEDFFHEGFQNIVDESGLGADIVAVDAHLGYYRKRTLMARIKEDVVEPARAAGYDRIVLVGISMGGLGAALYAKQHPQDVAAVVLIAPFLGDKPVLDEISAAGGIAKWKPQEPVPESDYQRDIWNWLRGYTDPKVPRPQLYLGFGTEDRFLRSHRLLAAALPPSRVFTAPGAHTWDPWRAVFRQILTSGYTPSGRR
jgi:pimeloyl-ACP methyl ester carboxylesterase